MAEADLYPIVEKWARRHFDFWETGVNTGLRMGRIDVVGVRDVGGDLSGRAEVVSIEVKAGKEVFATSAGQAHGYSVMADRCYLADLRDGPRPFSQDEVLIAGRLGIGLIAISSKNRCKEVLTAPPNEPLEELRLQVLERLGLAHCALCATVFHRSVDSPSDFKGVVRVQAPGALSRAVEQRRGLMWWLESEAEKRDRRGRNQIYWRRYLCPDCTLAFAGPD